MGLALDQLATTPRAAFGGAPLVMAGPRADATGAGLAGGEHAGHGATDGQLDCALDAGVNHRLILLRAGADGLRLNHPALPMRPRARFPRLPPKHPSHPSHYCRIRSYAVPARFPWDGVSRCHVTLGRLRLLAEEIRAVAGSISRILQLRAASDALFTRALTAPYIDV